MRWQQIKIGMCTVAAGHSNYELTSATAALHIFHSLYFYDINIVYRDIKGVNMKNTVLLLLLTAIISFFTGCGRQNIDFSDEVFLKYTSAPAGECEIFAMYDTNVAVSSDGTAEIYCDDFEDVFYDEYPTRLVDLSEEDITVLKDAIRDNGIISLPEDISEESCDGDYRSMTVYQKDGEHHTGGLNPDNKKFKAVEQLLYNMVKDDMAELKKEVNDLQERGYNSKFSDQA